MIIDKKKREKIDKKMIDIINDYRSRSVGRHLYRVKINDSNKDKGNRQKKALN